jgi:hypothetical protein
VVTQLGWNICPFYHERCSHCYDPTCCSRRGWWSQPRSDSQGGCCCRFMTRSAPSYRAWWGVPRCSPATGRSPWLGCPGDLLRVGVLSLLLDNGHLEGTIVLAIVLSLEAGWYLEPCINTEGSSIVLFRMEDTWHSCLVVGMTSWVTLSLLPSLLEGRCGLGIQGSSFSLYLEPEIRFLGYIYKKQFEILTLGTICKCSRPQYVL